MTIRIVIDGQPRQVAAGISVAAALAGEWSRRSVGGEARAPLCGMGVCFECRVAIDGRPQQRACQVLVREGMEVRRGD